MEGPIKPVLAVKICRTGPLNRSFAQRQATFILHAVENKRGASMRRLAQHSLSKNPTLYLGQPQRWGLLVQDRLAHCANDILTSFIKRMPDLFQRKSNPPCVTSLRQVQYFLAALKRAVHYGDQETTPMTALKRQITPKANPVPLPVILFPFNTIKNRPTTSPKCGHWAIYH